jgi:hypothetical protein
MIQRFCWNMPAFFINNLLVAVWTVFKDSSCFFVKYEQSYT